MLGTMIQAEALGLGPVRRCSCSWLPDAAHPDDRVGAFKWVGDAFAPAYQGGGQAPALHHYCPRAAALWQRRSGLEIMARAAEQVGLVVDPLSVTGVTGLSFRHFPLVRLVTRLAVGGLMAFGFVQALLVLVLVAALAGHFRFLLLMRLVALAALELHGRVGRPVHFRLGQGLVAIEALLASRLQRVALRQVVVTVGAVALGHLGHLDLGVAVACQADLGRWLEVVDGDGVTFQTGYSLVDGVNLVAGRVFHLNPAGIV